MSKKLSKRPIELANEGDASALLLALSSPKWRAEDFSNCLWAASGNGHIECVKLLIPSIDPKADDSFALRIAARNGHAQCVELLIPLSDPKANNPGALGWAATNGHATIVKLLLSLSDPKAGDSFALRASAAQGQGECVSLLLPFSDPQATNKSGQDADALARANGHTGVSAMIEAFIEARALSGSCPLRGKTARSALPFKHAL